MTQLSTFGRILLLNFNSLGDGPAQEALMRPYELYHDLTGFQQLSPDELIDAAKQGKNRIPIILPGPKPEFKPEPPKKVKPVEPSTDELIAKLNSEYPSKLYTRM